MAETLFHCEQLVVGIAGRPLCGPFDLTIKAGERWGVLGPNGVGKSSLLQTMAALIPAHSGRIELAGRPIDTLVRRQIARHIGLLPQNHHDPFPNNLLEIALTGRHPHLGPWQNEGVEDYRLAHETLELVGLGGLEHRMVNTLSGGERRRLGIATLLIQEPRLMLLDEPSNHLDLHHQIKMLGIVHERCSNDCASMMVLHDPNLAERFCSHLFLIGAEGRVKSGPAGELFNEETLSQLYNHPIERVGSRKHGAWVAVVV